MRDSNAALKMQTMDRLIDQKAVSEIMGVSTKTLEYWRWKKIGPKFLKVGKLARYLESDIQEFISQLAKGGKL
jgi:predicted DNA-binding transcriptional regulator AlpA